MADKNYRLIFTLSDGTEESVQFTVPQGEKGDKGDSGVMTVNGVAPDENGNVEIPTGGGYSKTVLWEWEVGLRFTTKTLSLPIGGYDAIEIIYLHDCCHKKMASSGELPMPTGEYISRCFLLTTSGTVTTTVDIASDGTFTFTLKDDECGTPWKIYGIKHGNSADDSGEVSYTNVLDSVGYQIDTVIENYEEVLDIGWDVTGYIEVAGGDIIRLKNVTMPDVNGDSNRVHCYRWNKSGVKSFSITSDNTANSPVFKDGNLVQFTILDTDIKEFTGDTGWIRIGAKNIDENSIITVNEEID